jgi:hypothetical protein
MLKDSLKPKGSWQPKVLAVLVLLSALTTQAMNYLDSDPTTTVNIDVLIPLVIAAVGLFITRQNNVPSAAVGIEGPAAKRAYEKKTRG